MQKLFQQLKSRGVIRAAIAYLAAAWLLVQVSDVVTSILDLSPQYSRYLLLAAAIGFPVTLVLTWIFDLTPQGIRITESDDDPAPTSFSRNWSFAIIGMLVVALSVLIIDNYVLDFGATKSDHVTEVLPNSIAVLPFENLSPDPDNAFFAAGIHNTVINELTHVRDINVIAASSVLLFAGSGRSIAEVAEQLNIETVMEGSVQFDVDRVRVSVVLTEASSNTMLWGNDYDRDVSRLFEIQTEIAENIAMALEVELLANERERVEKVPTDSLAAWSLYLRALDLSGGSGQFSGDAAASEAHALLDRAIDLDAEFASAYAAKASLHLNDDISGQEAEVERLLQVALELDPEDTFALSLHAMLLQQQQRYAEARMEIEAALEVAPNNMEHVIQFASLEMITGDYDEARALIQKARVLDPLNPFVQKVAGFSELFAGLPGMAVDPLRHVNESYPGEPITHLELTFALIGSGDFAEAREHLAIAEQLLPIDAPAIVLASYGYSLIGDAEAAQRTLEQYRETAAGGPIEREGNEIMAHLVDGDEKEALALLELIATENRAVSFGVTLLVFNVWNDPVLNTPEFLTARRALGFPE